MIISHKYQFIFIHVHKTGGQSVTAAITPHLGPRDTVILGHLAKPGVSQGQGLAAGERPLEKHSSADEVRRLLDPELWTTYRKAAVVRDPVSRIQSLYAYLKRVHQTRMTPVRRLWYATAGRRQDPMTWAAMQALVATDNFGAFIRHPALRADPAMRPQWSMLTGVHGELLVDKVLRTETLSTDFRTLTAWLGLPEDIGLPHINVSQPSPDRAPISDADVEYLRTMFSDDVEHLSY